METITGTLENITFCNEENHFTVARVREKDKQELTTVVGNLVGLTPGESLKLSGYWVMNKKFGQQFKVEHFETIVPATVNGMEKYLGSGLVKGIGPVMAKRIVQVFGLDTIEVIDNAPERLNEVEGIGAKRIEMIRSAWEGQRDIKDIMVFLQGHGISANYAARIYKRYGRESIALVRENPYRLAADIDGIGFLTADRIAASVGIDPQSIIRAEEGILYVLNELMEEGHVYYPYEELVDRAAQMLKVERDTVLKAIAALFEDKRLIIEDLGSDPGFKPNDKAVYLALFYHAEAALARMLAELAVSGQDRPLFDPQAALASVESELHISLAAKQREAVMQALLGQVLIVTGGPGTGKTTIIRSILQLYTAMGLKTLLTAPTGRAARRMQEATGQEAKTIHRLLEFSFQQGGFTRDQDSPLNADAVIVDEASMIDTMLMYHLVKAVPPGARFILVGDIHQLPSVGPGSVLRDMIDSALFPVVTLTEIFRQASESRIVVNAHCINRGDFPDLTNPPPDTLSDFYFIQDDTPETVVEKIVRMCRERIPRRFELDPVRDIQVITPMRRGTTGVANLNAELQNALNQGSESVARGARVYKVNDKVMQIVNNYDKDVFNGDIGWITEIIQERQEITVDFEGRSVRYDYTDLDELVLAYAVSVHKSQGSEYPAVVMPFTTQHYMMLQRNLLYTGITRGKRLVVVIGTKKALGIAIRNDTPHKRYTRLKERLAGSGE